MTSERVGLRALAAVAALSSLRSDVIQINAFRDDNPGPPPEGARRNGYPTTGKSYRPNGKREMERRRRQLAKRPADA